MYVLAAATFAVAVYFYFQGDLSNAKYAAVAGAILMAARIYFGAQEEGSILRRFGFGIQIVIIIAIILFGIDAMLGGTLKNKLWHMM